MPGCEQPRAVGWQPARTRAEPTARTGRAGDRPTCGSRHRSARRWRADRCAHRRTQGRGRAWHHRTDADRHRKHDDIELRRRRDRRTIATIHDRRGGVHIIQSLRRRLDDDRRRARLRREERTITNSAIFGLAQVVLGATWVAMCWWLDALDSFQVGLTIVLMGSGALRLWAGFRRWRAGGEFNLPGRPGPILRSPPANRRGD
jgi:hypothetical protein